jgi:hypothetical protein
LGGDKIKNYITPQPGSARKRDGYFKKNQLEIDCPSNKMDEESEVMTISQHK